MPTCGARESHVKSGIIDGKQQVVAAGTKCRDEVPLESHVRGDLADDLDQSHRRESVEGSTNRRARGGHVRAGLEDVAYGCESSNAELVAAAAKEIHRAGGALANAQEVRATLAGARE